jgi:hypothetical protein
MDDGPNKTDYTGLRTCLVYCEAFDDHPMPKDAVLPWTGNLAMEHDPRNQDRPLGGTYVLHRESIVDNLILPEMQPLCSAIELILEPAKVSDDGHGTRVFNAPYHLAAIPEETADSTANRKVWAKTAFMRDDTRHRWGRDIPGQHTAGNTSAQEYQANNQSFGWSRSTISGTLTLECGNVFHEPETDVQNSSSVDRGRVETWPLQHLAPRPDEIRILPRVRQRCRDDLEQAVENVSP